MKKFIIHFSPSAMHFYFILTAINFVYLFVDFKIFEFCPILTFVVSQISVILIFFLQGSNLKMILKYVIFLF